MQRKDEQERIKMENLIDDDLEKGESDESDSDSNDETESDNNESNKYFGKKLKKGILIIIKA